MSSDQPARPPVPPGPGAGPADPGTSSAPRTAGPAVAGPASAARARASAAAKKALRGATTVVTGTAPGTSTDDPGRPGTGARPSAGTGGSPRATDPKDPTISATETATRPPRPAPAAAPATARDGAPRRVRLSLSRIDPWSVMKLSFLLSFAVGVMIVVAAAVIWLVLDNMAVFTTVNDMLTEIVGEESPIDLLQFLDFARVVSGAAVIAIIDVVLLTALSTLGAFLYNITAALVGGVNVTLTDE
jgi:Transmembrane domain of unknown function (DUF3566)